MTRPIARALRPKTGARPSQVELGVPSFRSSHGSPSPRGAYTPCLRCIAGLEHPRRRGSSKPAGLTAAPPAWLRRRSVARRRCRREVHDPGLRTPLPPAEKSRSPTPEMALHPPATDAKATHAAIARAPDEGLPPKSTHHDTPAAGRAPPSFPAQAQPKIAPLLERAGLSTPGARRRRCGPRCAGLLRGHHARFLARSRRRRGRPPAPFRGPGLRRVAVDVRVATHCKTRRSVVTDEVGRTVDGDTAGAQGRVCSCTACRVNANMPRPPAPWSELPTRSRARPRSGGGSSLPYGVEVWPRQVRSPYRPDLLRKGDLLRAAFTPWSSRATSTLGFAPVTP